MARLLYTVVFYLLLPLVLLRLLWRAYKAPAYAKRWQQRFGFFTAPGKGGANSKPVICLHSVSVGETIAAAPLVKALQQQYPDFQLVVTTTTPTGSEQVLKLFGDSVFHVYLPYDLPDAIGRFLRKLKPRVFMVMETELWPNLLAACDNRDIPVFLLNGRMSERSARGYKKFSGLSLPMMQRLSRVLAQTTVDAERYLSLGVKPENCKVSGNIKFDLCLDQPLVDKAKALQQQWQNGTSRPVWVAASTHLGEDEQILAAFKQVLHKHPDCLLVLVPRHPERFKSVGELCSKQDFSLQKRSDDQEINTATQVLLGDSMGEVLAFYGACDIAFVGGSLVENGGHNMIEAAAWGKPIITGLSCFNFAEARNLLVAAQAMLEVANEAELAEQVITLLGDIALRESMSLAAAELASDNRGALDTMLLELKPFLDG